MIHPIEIAHVTVLTNRKARDTATRRRLHQLTHETAKQRANNHSPICHICKSFSSRAFFALFLPEDLAIEGVEALCETADERRGTFRALEVDGTDTDGEINACSFEDPGVCTEGTK